MLIARRLRRRLSSEITSFIVGLLGHARSMKLARSFVSALDLSSFLVAYKRERMAANFVPDRPLLTQGIGVNYPRTAAIARSGDCK